MLIVDPIGGDARFLVDYVATNGGLPMVADSGAMRAKAIAECDSMIVNLATIDHAFMAQAPRCRVIARLGVGTDNIDLDAARLHDIRVTNVPDYCADEVAEHALTLILASVRKIGQAHQDVQNGIWEQLGYRPIRRFSDLVLGLVGFGKLAQGLARRARSLGFQVIASDPFAESSDLARMVSFDTLLMESDIVSLHAPSTATTRHMLNRDSLARCGKHPVIVNTARGDLIDEAALVAALDDGTVSAAALDVFAEEPLPSESRLRGRSNVLLTPHMAFYSEHSLEQLQRQAADDVLAVLAGADPRHPVN